MIGNPVRVLEVPKAKPIRAYRAWSGASKCLTSYYKTSVVWNAGTNRADRKPTKRSGSGFWAFKTRRSVRSQVSIGLVGAVDLWGKVVEHSDGYRAEFARIVSGPILKLAAGR